jgi:PAS domain S-box-containing protein/putative nucleotidyltransferase with HDIG domain
MIFVSEQICSLTGYTYEDLVGKVGLFLVHDDDKEIVRENLQKVLTSDLGPAEYRLVKPDGQIYSVEVNPVILEDDQGNPKNIVLSVRDISERKHSEKALRESENLFRSVVETSHAGIVIVDNAFHMTYVNDELCCIIDRPRDELIGHDFREFLDKESQELVADRYIRRQKGENIEPRYEFNLFRKNGEKRRVEISTAVIKDSNDKPVSISQILDVTGRKKAELNLRQSEEKYKTLTENVNVGIYRNTADSKGKFIEVNSALVRMFGHENKEDFLKLDVSELYQIPSDRKKFNEKMVEYGFVKDEILQLKKKDGTPFFASVSAVAVKDDKGNILYYDGIIDDITDRIRAEQDLKNSYTRLKKVLNGTVSALASTTEKRDPYTAGHQHRVTQLAAAIAQEMGFSSDRIDGIKVAGIVHDIGKIHVAAEILNKPVALNDIEMELVKTHCQAGYEILKTIDFPWDVAEIVLQHHERINGSGYPRGLTGEQIMLEAKIIAVADVVEAMVSHRPYRAALSTDMALEEISSNRGVLFDDEIVEICLKLFGQGFEFK